MHQTLNFKHFLGMNYCVPLRTILHPYSEIVPLILHVPCFSACYRSVPRYNKFLSLSQVHGARSDMSFAWFNRRHKHRRRSLSAFTVGEVRHGVSLVQRSPSWSGLWQQVARVVKSKVGRALLALTRARLALTVQQTNHTSSSKRLTVVVLHNTTH